MVVFPPCKINIGLDILNRRPDGYHNIRTVFYPLPLYDVLEAVPSAKTQLHLYGLPINADVSDNLCISAYKLIKADFPQLSSYAIHLYKNIPMGAGLGGGSSDAAFMLRLINKIAHLELSKTQLHNYASRLGSDCSFFMENAPCLAEGRGEILHPVEIPALQAYQLVLLYPLDIQVHTAEAYRLIRPQPAEVNLAEAIRLPVRSWKKAIKNDFEAAVFKLHPALKEIKEMLYAGGAEYASMSGSGSAIYGLFPGEVDSVKFMAKNISVQVFNLSDKKSLAQ